MNILPFSVNPIGIFQTRARYPYEATRQGVTNDSDEVGVIELRSGMQFEQALESLEGFERIWVIYQFHHNKNWKPKVIPPRGSLVKRGVFATRSPYRPNPIGLSCMELLKVEGLKVYVRGFDLLDTTPILDIKPYLPYADAFPKANQGWLEGIEEQALVVRLSCRAEKQLAWLEKNGVTQLRIFLKTQLQFNPTDAHRKRVTPIDLEQSRYALAYRTWRVRFQMDKNANKITVENIYSGYSAHDLDAPADPYEDKEIHRSFKSEFEGTGF